VAASPLGRWLATSFALSPDGRWLATILDPGTLSLVPLEGGEIRTIRGIPSDLWVGRFSGEGRSIFLGNMRSMPCQIHRLNLATERLDLWKQVTPLDMTGLASCGGVLPSADGSSYAYTYQRLITDLVVAEGLR
jgi:hypothetical protein